jgi:sarcosine oxidase gamma subunit
VLELAPLKLAVVACLGRAGDLERLEVRDTLKVRTAPDEALLLAPPGRVAGVVAAAIAAMGKDALVVDQTDAYSGWTISGSDVFELFARLSAIPLEGDHSAMLQGLVAKVPAKILVTNSHLQLLVSSNLAHHIKDRVLSAGADLEARLGEAVEFHPATAMQTVA